MSASTRFSEQCFLIKKDAKFKKKNKNKNFPDLGVDSLTKNEKKKKKEKEKKGAVGKRKVTDYMSFQ